MMNLVAFKPEHVYPLLEQRINADVRKAWLNGFVEMAAANESSMTVMVNDTPMVCGGVAKIWEGRGCVWTIFNEESKGCFVPVFRGIKKFLELQSQRYSRLELAVPIGFETGHRRALMLGFKVECELARKFLPSGEDCTLYSIVAGGA